VDGKCVTTFREMEAACKSGGAAVTVEVLRDGDPAPLRLRVPTQTACLGPATSTSTETSTSTPTSTSAALSVESAESVETDRVLFWSGAVLQRPPAAIEWQRGRGRDGVYVACKTAGSPADRYRLSPTSTILEVDGVPTPDLQVGAAAAAAAWLLETLLEFGLTYLLVPCAS
jgi:S1-C subfamily serine protease